MEGAGVSGIETVADWQLNERFYGGWQGKNSGGHTRTLGEGQSGKGSG